MSLLEELKRLDAYPKTLDDFRVKTYAGAVVTVVSALIIATLLVSEFSFYLTVETDTSLQVDVSREERMKINFNVTLQRLSCMMVSVDVLDVSGEHQSDIEHNILKSRVGSDGRILAPTAANLGEAAVKAVAAAPTVPENYCGSCYGGMEPSSGCCNTCDEVRESYRRRGWSLQNIDDIEQCQREGFGDRLREQMDEGCNVYGVLYVNKVAGNFHFAPGKSFQAQHMHVHDTNQFNKVMAGKKFDMSHTVHRLSFGDDFPDIVNPLDRRTKSAPAGSQMAYQYFIKVVPTSYVYLNGTQLATNQFSYTLNDVDMAERQGGLPGVFFNFDISPMRVTYRQTSRSFLHFLTGVCAIVGGVFTVAGMVDGAIYTANRSLKRKIQLGKAS